MISWLFYNGTLIQFLLRIKCATYICILCCISYNLYTRAKLTQLTKKQNVNKTLSCRWRENRFYRKIYTQTFAVTLEKYSYQTIHHIFSQSKLLCIYTSEGDTRYMSTYYTIFDSITFVKFHVDCIRNLIEVKKKKIHLSVAQKLSRMHTE